MPATPPPSSCSRQFLERPSLALWHGPRGSGKSYLSAIETHLTSRFNPRHSTRILGGSLSQSEQIYEALQESIMGGRGEYGSDADTLARLLKSAAFYHNGSNVSLLAASPTSVRGPHVPSLKLDEVDEIEPDIRESAMGMAMEKRGCRSSVLMTSTWHRVAGPMADLMDRGCNGAFPVDTFCIFEALETCPKERSGPNYEKCPECPLFVWCHSDRDSDPKGLPKAKRSNGHYTIDSLIQKVKAVSSRVFESDYLCLRPWAAGIWFATFNQAQHVRPASEYDPSCCIHLAIDPGVHTARSGSRSGHGSTGKATRSTYSPTTSRRGSRRRRMPGRSAKRPANFAEPEWDGCESQWTRPVTLAQPSAPRSAASTSGLVSRAGTVSNRGRPERKPMGSSLSRPCSNQPTRPSTSRSILVAGT